MRKPPIEKWVTWFLITSAVIGIGDRLITGIIKKNKWQQIREQHTQRNNASSVRY